MCADRVAEANAFVLPGGKVFVHTGILPICRDDDGLATVLAHEMAHNVAQHVAEKLSTVALLEPLLYALVIFDPTRLSQILAGAVFHFGIMMPSSRVQEREADHIGLMIMAQSCFEPRRAVELWERMARAHAQAHADTLPQWLSTHPSVSVAVRCRRVCWRDVLTGYRISIARR